MPAKKDEEKKVMDIASPSEAKPDTGSKPMVVGHKFLSTDPDVKSADSESANEVAAEKSEEPTATLKKKIVLEPISDNIKIDEEKSDNEASSQDPEETKAEEKLEETPESKDEKNEEKPADDPGIEEASEERTAEEKQSEEDKANLEKEERLQEIIKSKEYYVPIKHQGASAVKTFLITFLLVCLLGAVLLAVLVDAEIIDVGIDLPFDLL